MISLTHLSKRWTAIVQFCPFLLLGTLLLGLIPTDCRLEEQNSNSFSIPGIGSSKSAILNLQSEIPGLECQDTPAAAKLPLTAGMAPRQQDRLLSAVGVVGWHKKGHRGQKVKVAILDSGFKNYRTFLGNALPQSIQTGSFRGDGNLEAKDSQHGVLCAEVVHTVAPETDLLFVNWEPNEPDSFLQAVRWAKEQGAKIISCSLIMPSWSDGEGGGVVNQTLAEIAGKGDGPNDLLFFASAGNTAQRHWCGTFDGDANGYHQWRAGEINNTLIPWGDERVSVELYGPTAGDYELVVEDSATGKQVGDQRLRQLGTKEKKVNCVGSRFFPTADQNYRVLVRHKKSSSAKSKEKIHLMVLGGQLDFSCSQGSISCPADCPAALAVGAVNAEGKRWYYSSCGPNSPLPKPDFVAIVPFPSKWRDRPFTGTSAAAPQAAGLAALWWSKNPDWTAAQIKEAMSKTALDLGPVGHDFETGYGLARVP